MKRSRITPDKRLPRIRVKTTLTPFESLFTIPPDKRDPEIWALRPKDWGWRMYKRGGGWAWLLDKASGKVYCPACAWDALAGSGFTVESVGAKLTTSRKLLGESPRCARCNKWLVDKPKRPAKPKRSGFERATVTFFKELAKMVRRR